MFDSASQVEGTVILREIGAPRKWDANTVTSIDLQGGNCCEHGESHSDDWAGFAQHGLKGKEEMVRKHVEQGTEEQLRLCTYHAMAFDAGQMW